MSDPLDRSGKRRKRRDRPGRKVYNVLENIAIIYRFLVPKTVKLNYCYCFRIPIFIFENPTPLTLAKSKVTFSILVCILNTFRGYDFNLGLLDSLVFTSNNHNYNLRI